GSAEKRKVHRRELTTENTENTEKDTEEDVMRGLRPRFQTFSVALCVLSVLGGEFPLWAPQLVGAAQRRQIYGDRPKKGKFTEENSPPRTLRTPRKTLGKM
ncbi:hypothetical protein, partial [Shumkonia mesophila]|uniref:hypothetical protein n=1 Tax=Shumkonia mesophila TaxID=2838854 RepID=UPI0029343711